MIAGSRGGVRRLAVMVMAVAPMLHGAALGQSVEDGSDAALGQADTRTILDLIRRELKAPDAKVSALRRHGTTHVCGSVNVKNRDGLYTGERGFLVDLTTHAFGRVPDGPEMLSPRSEGFREREAIRQDYFARCLDE